MLETIITFSLVLSFRADWTIPRGTFFTSYNPVEAQTDSSPCIGASGKNLCSMGVKTIALSQDLVGRRGKPYTYGQKVRLISDNPQCNGVFQIEDTMHKRWRNRGDIFQMERKNNTSCYALINLLP